MKVFARNVAIVFAVVVGLVLACGLYRHFLFDDGGTKKQAESFSPMTNWELVHTETDHKTPMNRDKTPETSLAYIDHDTNATRDNFAAFVDELAGANISEKPSDPSMSQFFYCATENVQPDDLDCSAEFKKKTENGAFHYRINVYYPEDKNSEIWVTISPTEHIGKVQGPGL